MNPTKALAHPITLEVFPLPNRVMEVVAVYEDPETAETPALDSVSRAFVDHVSSLSALVMVKRSPCRSTLQVINGGRIQLPEQSEEVSFVHSPFFLL